MSMDTTKDNIRYGLLKKMVVSLLPGLSKLPDRPGFFYENMDICIKTRYNNCHRVSG